MISIGIDLGTTNSLAAYVPGDGGTPVVLKGSNGEVMIPSVVSASGSGDTLLVGRAARNNSDRMPNDTIFSIKRLIGRDMNDPRIEEVKRRYPYAVVPAPEASEDTVPVQVICRGKHLKPTDISTLILQQVVQVAEDALGQKVSMAVLTVPAYFTDRQRSETRKAGLQAGLIIKKMIDEPTAAAVSFGMSRDRSERHMLLVFDMGGGTTDVSILAVTNQQFVVQKLAGDMWLGGDDLDNQIVEMIINWVKTTYEVDLTQNRQFRMIAKRYAEEAKILLSEQEEVDIVIPAIVPLSGGEPAPVNMRLTHTEAEERFKPFIDRALNLVQEALAKASMTPDSISTVLMVGGSTLMPSVFQAMVDIFGEEKVRRHVDPMYAVALGAAILANELTGVECPSCQYINPYTEDMQMCIQCGQSLAAGRAIDNTSAITAHDLGIGTLDEKGNPDSLAIIIPEGTPYPLKKAPSRLFLTTADRITIPVYQGNNPAASRNAYQGLLEIELPPDVPVGTPVAVRFNLDRDRVITVHVEIHGRPELSHEAPVDRESHPARAIIGQEAWRAGLQNAIAIGTRLLSEYRDFIDPSQVTILEQKLNSARQALSEGDQMRGQDLRTELLAGLDQLGVANVLMLTELTMMGEAPETVRVLASAVTQLKTAYKQGNSADIDLLSTQILAQIRKLTERRERERGQEISYTEGILQQAAGLKGE